MKLWEKERNKAYPIVDAYEKSLSFAVDSSWFHRLALQTQVVIKKSEICYQHGRLLYTTLSHYIKKNNPESLTVLETGTARGFSALCMSKALSDRGKSGKILTFDLLPHHVKMFWNCMADHRKPMSRAELLQDYRDLMEKYMVFIQGDTRIQLKKIQLPRIHFAFFDGAHTYTDLWNEFVSIRDKQEKGDMLFFDDYTPKLFSGIVRAVDEISEQYHYTKQVIRIGEFRGYAIATKR